MDIARNLVDSTRGLVDAARDLTTSSPDPERAYRLRTGEHVPDGIRRIARGQLLDAHDDLEGTPARKLGEAVHETRKRTKRLRACVRLARDAIGDEVYRRENAALRTAARRISGPRDAQVLLETLDALSARFADELAPDATARLRARLDEEHRAATAAVDDGDRDGARRSPRPARSSTRSSRARPPGASSATGSTPSPPACGGSTAAAATRDAPRARIRAPSTCTSGASA